MHAVDLEQFRASPIWLAPIAREQCEGLLRSGGNGTTIVPLLTGEHEESGPAIMILHVDDMVGPNSEALRRIAKQALPGRPIVFGKQSHKDVLLEAINTWQAFEFLTPETLMFSLNEAVAQAQHSLELELAVSQRVEELTEECRHLHSVTQELQVTSKRLIHTERLATLGRVVGTVLERMRQQVDHLDNLKRAQEEVAQEGNLAEIFEAAVAGVDSFGALLEDLLALTEHREAKNQQAVMNLDELCQRAVRLFRHDVLARKREIQVECRSEVPVLVDSCRVIHVLLNLLRNAAQATEAGGKIALETRCEGKFGVIEVTDDGCGMSKDTLANLFTPFFTTKGAEGMGLGLRLAKAMVETHGGTIGCESSLGHGTTFKIRLPIASSE